MKTNLTFTKSILMITLLIVNFTGFAQVPARIIVKAAEGAAEKAIVKSATTSLIGATTKGACSIEKSILLVEQTAILSPQHSLSNKKVSNTMKKKLPYVHLSTDKSSFLKSTASNNPNDNSSTESKWGFYTGPEQKQEKSVTKFFIDNWSSFIPTDFSKNSHEYVIEKNDTK